MSSSSSSTQAPWSFRSSLPALGISLERADALVAKYNRRLVPIVEDEVFYQKLQQAATKHEVDQVEDQLAISLGQENIRSFNEYVKAKFELGIDGLECFETEAQQFCFLNGLRMHTIHGFEGIISTCLPPLIQACRNRSYQQSSKRDRPNRVRKRNVEAVKPAMKGIIQQEASSPRRSARIRGQKAS